MSKVRITYLVPRGEFDAAEFLGEWDIVETIADVHIVQEVLDLDELGADGDPGLELTEIVGGPHFHRMGRVY